MHLRIYFYLQEEPVVTLEEFMYKKTVDAPALFLKQPCWVKATLRKNYKLFSDDQDSGS